MALTITIPGGPIQLSDLKVWVKINTTLVQGSLYNVLLKVTNTNGELDGLPQTLENIPDANGDAWFDISGLLRRIFTPDFGITAGIVSTERAGIPYKIAIDIGETFVDATDVRQENWSELTGAQYEIILLRGGVSPHQQNIYTEITSNFYQDFIVGGKWLTELPNPLTIAPDMLMKLWYMTPEATQQTLDLLANYTLLDGTTGTVTIPCTVNPGSIYEFNVDPVSLGLTVSGVNPVQTYEVFLKSGVAQIIESFVFNINYSVYEENFQVLYRNKFSGIDPLWLHGKSEFQFNAVHEINNRPQSVTDDSRTRTKVVSSKRGRRQWIINVGHKLYDEIMALQSVLLSRQMWLIQDGYAIPVNIEASQPEIASKTENINEYTLELTEAHENKYM